MFENAFLSWAIQLLEQIDSSTEEKEWCRSYSVYSANPGQDSLRRDLWALIDRTYENGLVITNYREVIQLWGLDEKCIALANAEYIEKQPYLCVLASIAWHFRRDHFCEGALINQSVADGSLLRLFQRLKFICPGSTPATTLQNLYRGECKFVPETAGIYRVLLPEGMPVCFTAQVYNRSASLYPTEVLLNKYKKCVDKEVLYIGKADGQKGLRQRLKQYMNYGWNSATNHKGGRAIWQIEHPGLLLLDYEECEDARAREKRLLSEYKDKNDTYPLANWRG